MNTMPVPMADPGRHRSVTERYLNLYTWLSDTKKLYSHLTPPQKKRLSQKILLLSVQLRYINFPLQSRLNRG